MQQFINGQDLEQELVTAGTLNQATIRELLESMTEATIRYFLSPSRLRFSMTATILLGVD